MVHDSLHIPLIQIRVKEFAIVTQEGAFAPNLDYTRDVPDARKRPDTQTTSATTAYLQAR